MSAFSPEDFPVAPQEFGVPAQPGFNPEIRGDMPKDPFLAQPIETKSPAERYFDDLCFVGDSMNNLIKTGGITKASGDWLLDLAWNDPRETEKLKNRFTRPGGFHGINSNVIRKA